MWIKLFFEEKFLKFMNISQIALYLLPSISASEQNEKG